MKPRSSLFLVAALVVTSQFQPVFGDVTEQELQQQINSLKVQIAELQAKQNENWLTEERTAEIRGIVEDVLKDAKTRGQFADGPSIGYANGFYIQTPDKNYKLVINGTVQARYEFDQANAYNGRNISTTVGSTTVTAHDPYDASGFSLRKARISLSGNAVTPDLTFKLEGDFYGSSTGAFTVTDAYAAYRITDLFKVRAGSFKVPFARVEQVSDPNVSMAERPEVIFPFDPQRTLGLSLLGDIISDKLAYEVNVNDGSLSNTFRRPDTQGTTPNLDNRLAFYSRLQWAGSGKISDFADETDLRTDNSQFVWLAGLAAGYESQNSSNNALPAPQTTATGGISNADGPGFTNYTLNGDLFRGTIDWSAKYRGFSFTTAAFFQQFNTNPGVTGSKNKLTTGPFGAADSSFFQYAYYGQVGYFIIPQHLELIGRAGVIMTEGYPNNGEFYSVGANYYLYGHNLKIQSDVTFTPEAAYTDTGLAILQNTHDLIFRTQLQLRF